MFFINEQRDKLNKDFVRSDKGIAFQEQIDNELTSRAKKYRDKNTEIISKAAILKGGGEKSLGIDPMSLILTPGSFVIYSDVEYEGKAYKAIVDFNMLIWFIFE